MKNYILRNENAVLYECGFSCDNVIFLKINSKAFFITDARYTTEAKEKAKNVKVIDANGSLGQKAREILKSKKVRKVFFNPNEWSVSQFEEMEKNSKIVFAPKINLSQSKRKIKNKDEIKKLKHSALLGKKAFNKFAKFVKEQGIGLSEKELAYEAERILKDNGNLELSFKPIVAINENAAKPHALPSNKILQVGDLLLIDAGLKYKGFCSDRTRVGEVGANFHLGKKQSFKDKKRQKIYDIVLKAQKAAIKKIKPGVLLKDIDKAARDVIQKAGYGEFFNHSTGHGVGLDIHELPMVSSKSEDVIKEGMIFTIEPGIYLPNEFGIRIEDMVLVTKDGVKIL